MDSFRSGFPQGLDRVLRVATLAILGLTIVPSMARADPPTFDYTTASSRWGEYSSSGDPFEGFTASGDYAIYARGTSIEVVDYTLATNPTLLTNLPSEAHSVSFTGDPDCFVVGGTNVVTVYTGLSTGNPAASFSIPVPNVGAITRLQRDFSGTTASRFYGVGATSDFTFDLETPCGPLVGVTIRNSVPSWSSVVDVALQSGLAIATDGTALYAIDATGALPSVVGSVPITGQTDVDMIDGTTGVSCGASTLRTWDVSGAAPVLLGNASVNCKRVAVADDSICGSRCHCSDEANDQIHTIDVSDAANPVRTGSVSTVPEGGDARFGFIENAWLAAFGGTTDQRTIAYRRICTYPEFLAEDDNAFVANHAEWYSTQTSVGVVVDNSTLRTYDMNNLGSFVAMGTDSVLGGRDCETYVESTLSGGLKAVVGSFSEFRVYDLSDAANPTVLGSIAGNSAAVAVAPDGSIALRGDNLTLRVVDVTDPANPFDRGSAAIPNAVNDAIIDAPWAIVATTAQTARWDFSNPDAPMLEHATPYTSVRGISRTSNPDEYILAIDGPNGRVVRYDFDAQVELGLVQLPGFQVSTVSPISRGSGSESEIAYVADLSGSVFVIDWSDPTDPILLGEYTDPSFSPRGIAASWEGGVLVADIQYPGRAMVLPSHASGGATASPVWSEAATVTMGAGFPNPFRQSTTFRLSLARRADVRLDVYDVTGRRVRTLADGARSAGRHQITWDGRDGSGRPSAAGVYFARLVLGDEVEQMKVTLVR